MAPASLHKLKPLAAAIGLLLTLPTQAASISWTGTTGFWDVTGNWAPGLPNPTDDATINVPGVQTVIVRSGSYAVNSLNVAGDETMAVTGGSLTINGASNLALYSQSGGTLAGAGSVNISGSADWSGGTQSGSGSTNVNGSLAISSNNDKTLYGRTLSNNGATTWNSSYGAIYASNGAVINNNGTWLDQAGNTYNHYISSNGGAVSSFNNNGTYTKSGNASTSIGIAFNNASTGTVNVDGGSIYLSNSLTNFGKITTAANSTLIVQNSTFDNQGTLQGDGTLHTLNSNTALVNSGVLAPGVDGVGKLTISGDYLQTSSGYLDIQLTSLTSYDKLNVLGDVSLSGTLRILGLNGYNPIAGNSFTIATFDDGLADASDLTGIFSHIIWSGFNPGISFTASYFDHSIVLNATTAPVPVPGAIWLFGSGVLGLMGCARRTRVA
jgi:hypothetical protein